MELGRQVSFVSKHLVVPLFGMALLLLVMGPPKVGLVEIAPAPHVIYASNIINFFAWLRSFRSQKQSAHARSAKCQQRQHS